MEGLCIGNHQQPRALYVHTFGCQMNEYDSLRVARMLGQEGYRSTSDPASADVIFINTCSVREKAEQKVFSLLGRLKRLKNRNPRLKIVVAGCVAQQLGEDLLDRFPHVDLVLGTRAIGALPGLLHQSLEEGLRKAHLPEHDEEGWKDLFGQSPDWESLVVAPVTIMQGCDNFCTYCIVPYVRGRERSRPAEEILREIRILTRQGTREVLLLGQNVNSYGRGLPDGMTFARLLRRIAHETDVVRIRFTTSHPKDLNDDLIQCFAELDKLCRHIHLPFQAGSDRILARMNRRYSAADYLEKIARLRAACPDMGISADVMVGFPGETEEDFEATLDLIRTVRFDTLFSFRYSDRPFAKSSAYGDKVPEDVKARRLTQLQALQAGITLEKHRQEVGRVRHVLVESESKAGNGQLTGRTSQNRIVNFEGSKDLIGNLVPVRIEEAYSHSLKGVIGRGATPC
ncbi:tRNA-i(6)A37 thiotransferase enzyme MiaB [Desulfacinum hydrothermale DSM 13146]|uniref:tRNA-2-methylthio-N(6)-dimethylallyladenosine synthase n=1 Tax=Desulfacinum hydrothermale DSM 13146 TaxID=1121390 RepID=A0A1W1XUG4_9BACT|nr:tRNA (N6-isopentenyl adenosine(37)-C2)-methylthiotransferase MiaB [Desulfacinum hydrothermale]SMC27599.1 tRNA-i(6)A37 thiotransferase enzyme MiaB [Desulfacinum hydrothermale DSM 13146]